MINKPFLIYRSSAGSGKTYTLAYSYLKLALAQPFAFSQILGVTFTNKATSEMKFRIIEVLKELGNGADHSMKSDLKSDLQLTEEELMRRSKELLSLILHRYGQFSVSTIDSFFHQVIRHFAREIGLQGSFSISLDSDLILQQVVDDMLSDVGKDSMKQVRSWLTEFAGSLIEEGNSWDFRSSMYHLADQLLKEEFKDYSQQLLALSTQDFYDVQIGLTKAKKGFENKLKSIGEHGLLLMEPYGGLDAFKSKKSGPAGMFLKASRGEYDVSERRAEAKNNPDAWLTKKQLLNETLLYNVLQEQILPHYNELLEFIDAQSMAYKSAEAASRYIYTLGILSVISRYLQQYRDEHDVMLIPDLTDFLRRIIRDSDTPFIYEKIGTKYQHFLLDEFQDTSHFQWDNFKPLIKNAVSAEQASIVVGDVKQSIYRWRGGDWNLLQTKLQHDMEGFVQVENLESNYRSAHEIVRFNNSFFSRLLEEQRGFFSDMEEAFVPMLENIGQVYSDISQKAKSTQENGFVSFRFLENGPEWKDVAISSLIKQVEELQRQKHPLRDMAILTRTTQEGRNIADAFFKYRQSKEADADLSYEVISSEALLLEAHPVVKFLLSMLNWLHDEKNRIFQTEWLVHYCELTQKDFPQNINKWEELTPTSFKKNKAFVKTLPINEMVEYLIRLFELQLIKGSYAYLQGFQDAVLDFSKNEKSDITTFVDWWDKTGSKRSIQLSEDTQAIRILTIHKSKGLEFPIVFLPFLNWSLDATTGFKENIIWCEPPKKPPFDLLPVIPLKYVSDLKETYWAGDYWKERLDNYLDAINLLYVAMTRPVKALIVYAPEPSPKGKINHVGDVAHQLLSKEEAFNTEENFYVHGVLSEPSFDHPMILESALQSYESFPWRQRVSIQLKSRRKEQGDIKSLDPVDPRQRGIRLHELIGQIKTIGDLPRFSSDPLFSELEQLVSSDLVIDYFRDVKEVRTEPSILLPSGEMKRLDRLVKKGEDWYVIDFKTGRPRKSDHQQVAGYLNVLKDMGIKDPKGRLVYLEPLKVEEVKS